MPDYIRPPTVGEILAAFPVECRIQIPKRLKQKRGLLRRYLNIIIDDAVEHVPPNKRDIARQIVLAQYPHHEITSRLTEQIKHLEAIANKLHGKKGERLDVEKARAYPLVDLCHELGIELRHNGSRHVGLCPLHDDRHPSFYVFDDNHWRCFGCGEHGDTIALVMRMQSKAFVEAVRYLT
jgi:DNA primase